ncbi:hypothetical protein [Streptomyces scopuliridis]|uniref:hypothetical protein n=1 Tax=Streptomyces scopuliridis TaxID=452529 RepID=UPI0034444D3A
MTYRPYPDRERALRHAARRHAPSARCPQLPHEVFPWLDRYRAVWTRLGEHPVPRGAGEEPAS